MPPSYHVRTRHSQWSSGPKPPRLGVNCFPGRAVKGRECAPLMQVAWRPFLPPKVRNKGSVNPTHQPNFVISFESRAETPHEVLTLTLTDDEQRRLNPRLTFPSSWPLPSDRFSTDSITRRYVRSFPWIVGDSLFSEGAWPAPSWWLPFFITSGSMVRMLFWDGRSTSSHHSLEGSAVHPDIDLISERAKWEKMFCYLHLSFAVIIIPIIRRVDRERHVPSFTAGRPWAVRERSLQARPAAIEQLWRDHLTVDKCLQPLNITQVEVMKPNKSAESFKIDWRKGIIWH